MGHQELSKSLNIDVALTLLADDLEFIPYRRTFRKITGSFGAAILLQQILYRAKGNGFRPFYKFRSPCSNMLYRNGDSWVEELACSADEFDTALKRIGTKIVKSEPLEKAMEGNDPTRLVIYWTDSNRVTWYVVNKTLLIYLINKAGDELSTQAESSYNDVNATLAVTKMGNSHLGDCQSSKLSDAQLHIDEYKDNAEITQRDTSYPYDVATQHHKDTTYLPVPVAQGNAVSASKAKQASKATTPKKAKAPAAKPKPMPLLASDSDDDAGYDDDVQEETENPTAHQAMFGAVCEAVGWDYRVLDARGSGQVAQTARILRDAGYEAEDVYDFIDNVWIKDWRWVKNNQLPTLTQLRQEIGKVKAIPAAKPDEDEWVTAEVHIQSEWYPNGAIKHERMSRKMATKWGFRIIDPC